MAQHLRLAKLTVRLYTPHDRRQYTPRRREEEGIRERKREKESERDWEKENDTPYATDTYQVRLSAGLVRAVVLHGLEL